MLATEKDKLYEDKPEFDKF